MRIPALIVTCTIFASGGVVGQSMYFYSDLDYDPGSGDAYTFAHTSADYSTQYYYDLYVYSQLNVSYDGGPMNVTCQRSISMSDSDAEVSCSIHVGTGTVDMQLISVHEVNVTYNVYQFDSYCSWDCYYWWDAYGTSFLGVGGTVFEDNQYFLAPGQPVARTPERKTVYGQIYRQRNNRPCNYPDYETSGFAMWSQSDPYVAYFIGYLQGAHNYNNRLVYERLIQLQPDTCWRDYMPGSPQTINFDPNAGATVGIQRAPDIGTFGTVSNAYGMDRIGFDHTVADVYQRYRVRMQQEGGQCGMIYGQQMSIDMCGGTLKKDYGWQHGLDITVRQTGLTVTRAGVSASKY